MRSLYEMGLMLTFFLMCVSVMHTIVATAIPTMPNLVEPSSLSSMDDNISSSIGVSIRTTGTNDAEGQKVEAQNDVTELLKIVKGFAFGWVDVLHEIFDPFELDYVAAGMIIIFGAIQVVTGAYLLMIMISVLTGGGVP